MLVSRIEDTLVGSGADTSLDASLVLGMFEPLVEFARYTEVVVVDVVDVGETKSDDIVVFVPETCDFAAPSNIVVAVVLAVDTDASLGGSGVNIPAIVVESSDDVES